MMATELEMLIKKQAEDMKAHQVRRTWSINDKTAPILFREVTQAEIEEAWVYFGAANKEDDGWYEKNKMMLG